MKLYNNFKIAGKLLTGFIIVALLAGAVGAVGIFELKTANKDYSALYDDYGVTLSYLTKVADGLQRTRVNIRDIMLVKDDSSRKNDVDEINTYEKEVEDNMALFKKAVTSTEDKARIEAFETAWANFKPVRDQEVSLALNNKEAEALAMSQGDGLAVSQKVDDAIKSLIAFNVETGGKVSSSLEASINHTILILIAIVIFAMIVAILLGLFISGTISKPIKLAADRAEQMAKGDYSIEIEENFIKRKDEIGMLAKAFKDMNDNFNDAMMKIDEAASQVATGSEQVSGTSITLSTGASEQASSVEELTASIEEISSQTKLNAENADQAKTLAEKAKTNAINGNEEMKGMLRAMDEINEASGNISRIIKVIDDIAFQTNILALNAAVEAARAGQHGKGFAVVAEEVRNLAARSASAAKETTDMIESSIKKVEGGSKIANETAFALNTIVEDIAKAASFVSSIAVASNEQSIGISQVSQGLTQVSAVIQSNSSTSEESAAASEELAGQAELLNQQVSRFKLKKMAIKAVS